MWTYEVELSLSCVRFVDMNHTYVCFVVVIYWKETLAHPTFDVDRLWRNIVVLSGRMDNYSVSTFEIRL